MTPHYRTLKKGARGTDVRAVQRTLKQRGIRKRKTSGYYGPGTINQVKEFQKRNKLKQDGVYGPATHRALEKHFDLGAKRMYRTYTVIHEAMFYIRNAAYVHYVQTRPMTDMGPQPNLNNYCDCSEFATTLFKNAGMPDPNGFGYNGYGFTGTMILHGTRVSDIRKAVPGRSLVFYGRDSAGNPTHVAVLISEYTVASHGSELGPYHLNYRYRHDVHSIRVYG